MQESWLCRWPRPRPIGERRDHGRARADSDEVQHEQVERDDLRAHPVGDPRSERTGGAVRHGAREVERVANDEACAGVAARGEQASELATDDDPPVPHSSRIGPIYRPTFAAAQPCWRLQNVGIQAIAPFQSRVDTENLDALEAVGSGGGAQVAEDFGERQGSSTGQFVVAAALKRLELASTGREAEWRTSSR